MTNGLLIYGEIFPYIIGSPSSYMICNCSTLNFLIYEKKLIFFFISVHCHTASGTCTVAHHRKRHRVSPLLSWFNIPFIGGMSPPTWFGLATFLTIRPDTDPTCLPFTGGCRPLFVFIFEWDSDPGYPKSISRFPGKFYV
jgi:hypothetical protein